MAPLVAAAAPFAVQMAKKLGPDLLLKLGGLAFGGLSKAFGGKSRQQKAEELLEQISQGQMPAQYQESISRQADASIMREQGELAARLQASGLRPGDPLYEAQMAALKRRRGGYYGRGTQGVLSQAGAATRQLAAGPRDNSFASLLSTSLPAIYDSLQKRGGGAGAAANAAGDIAAMPQSTTVEIPGVMNFNYQNKLGIGADPDEYIQRSLPRPKLSGRYGY